MPTPPPPASDRDQTSWPARLVIWVATAGPLGFSPYAPGTVGSVAGLAVAWGIGLIESPLLRLGLIAVITLVGIPLCTAAMRWLDRGKDPGCIVYDEVVALPVTFFLVEMRHVAVVIAGFLLFRFFDVLKPPPARQLERLPEGLGVMADDLAAAVYANLVLQGLVWSGWLVG